jgi:hypothetical protein
MAGIKQVPPWECHVAHRRKQKKPEQTGWVKAPDKKKKITHRLELAGFSVHTIGRTGNGIMVKIIVGTTLTFLTIPSLISERVIMASKYYDSIIIERVC